MLECKDTDFADNHQSDFDYDRLLQDLLKKHLQSERGQPKSMRQLSRNIDELMSGKYSQEVYTQYRRKDIWAYPVLICDGFLYSAPGMNDILGRIFDGTRKTKSAPLTVMTIEYLFRKIVDLQKGFGLHSVVSHYQQMRSLRLREFRQSPTAEGAFETFASIEEICGIFQLPYKAEKGFIREFYYQLGLPAGIEEKG